MNYETMHATDLLKALEGRSYCAVAEEIAHAEDYYNGGVAQARILKALVKGFLDIDDTDAYTITAKGLAYIDAFQDLLDDMRAEIEAEAEVEFRSSWVAGGGRKEDASLAWSMHRSATN